MAPGPSSQRVLDLRGLEQGRNWSPAFWSYSNAFRSSSDRRVLHRGLCCGAAFRPDRALILSSRVAARSIRGRELGRGVVAVAASIWVQIPSRILPGSRGCGALRSSGAGAVQERDQVRAQGLGLGQGVGHDLGWGLGLDHVQDPPCLHMISHRGPLVKSRSERGRVPIRSG